jgi:hypothetical protein
MSSQKAEIKACVCRSLEDITDEPLMVAGFRRRRSSLLYSRGIGDAVQKIDVAIQHHPKDRPDAAAVIYPYTNVRMDSVNSLVMDMVGGDTALGGAPDITLQEPIESTAAKQEHARWPIYQPDSVPRVVTEMRAFLQRWTIPLLDCYTTPAQICDAYERRDERIVQGLPYPLRVVAAMLLCGRNADAMTVMERHFGKLGPRRQYHRVFEYLKAKDQ